jgi:PT repeat
MPTKTPTKQPTKAPTKRPTKAPTKRPTKQPTKAPVAICGSSSNWLVAYINGITLSNRTLSLNGTSALDKALQYLNATNGNVGVQLSTCNPADRDRLRRRYAYLALIQSTGKSNMTSWFNKSDECQWTGFSCNGLTVGLDLSKKGLLGTIPDDVGLWTNADAFRVDENALVGSLPSTIGQWTSLIYFSVFKNKMFGSLPSSIGAWKGISYFNVANNQFVGSLPSSIGNWTGIFTFDVSTNQFGGTVPTDLSKWTSLATSQFSSVLFYSNMFTGTMPAFGNKFCPKNKTGGILQADCGTSKEIVCVCCNGCF